MKTVWKFPVVPDGDSTEVTIGMPKFAEVLHVGTQGNRAYLWVLVDPEQPPEKRKFEVYPTGAALHEEDYTYAHHLGTFTIESGTPLVFHLFERRWPDT